MVVGRRPSQSANQQQNDIPPPFSLDSLFNNVPAANLTTASLQRPALRTTAQHDAVNSFLLPASTTVSAPLVASTLSAEVAGSATMADFDILSLGLDNGPFGNLTTQELNDDLAAWSAADFAFDSINDNNGGSPPSGPRSLLAQHPAVSFPTTSTLGSTSSSGSNSKANSHRSVQTHQQPQQPQQQPGILGSLGGHLGHGQVLAPAGGGVSASTYARYRRSISPRSTAPTSPAAPVEPNTNAAANTNALITAAASMLSAANGPPAATADPSTALATALIQMIAGAVANQSAQATQTAAQPPATIAPPQALHRANYALTEAPLAAPVPNGTNGLVPLAPATASIESRKRTTIDTQSHHLEDYTVAKRSRSSLANDDAPPPPPGASDAGSDDLDDNSNGGIGGAYDSQQAKSAAEVDKRRRNTAASARFRQRKKQREHEMMTRNTQMSAQLIEHEERIRELERENAWLRSLITDRGQQIPSPPALGAQTMNSGANSGIATPESSWLGQLPPHPPSK